MELFKTASFTMMATTINVWFYKSDSVREGRKGMDMDSRIINDMLPLLTDEDRREIAQLCISKVDKIFHDFGYTIVKKKVCQPKDQPKIKTRSFYVNERLFPSKKKACEHYGVNYQTAINKLSDGVPPEEIFIEPPTTAIRREVPAH